MTMMFVDFKEGMTDKVAPVLVDTFLRNSEVLQLMPFDDAVSPTGGSTLTYGYEQTMLPSTAAFRALNTEYESSEATVASKYVNLKVFGGKFSMDRVLKQAEGKFNNMAYQLEQKIAAATSLFHWTMINGNATTAENEFDGLDKMLAGTKTEFDAASIDLSTAAQIEANASAFYEMLQDLINDTNADALMMNGRMRTKIQTVARVLGYKTESEESFGKKVLSMDGVRFIDLQNHYSVDESVATAKPIVGIDGGLTDIYAVKFDVNKGFHGVTLTGKAGLSHYLPDFNQPGAVKDGEVEMVAAVALKNTQNAGVLRDIKIA